MSREEVEELLPLIPDEDMETLYNFAVTLVPDDELTPEELREVQAELKDMKENGGVLREDIDKILFEE